MPRKRRASKVRLDAPNRLNDARLFYLQCGVCLSGLEDELGFDPLDLLQARVLWLSNEKEMLMKNVDRKNPGRRPWAWWICHYPDMRGESPREKYKFLKEKKLLEPWEVIAHDEFNKMAKISDDD